MQSNYSWKESYTISTVKGEWFKEIRRQGKYFLGLNSITQSYKSPFVMSYIKKASLNAKDWTVNSDSTNVQYVSRTFNSLSSMRKWLRNKALKWIWYINYIYYGTMKILNYFSHFIRIPSFHYNYILKSYFFDFHKKISHNVKGLINSKSLHFPLYQDPLVRRFQRTHQNLIWNLARKKNI